MSSQHSGASARRRFSARPVSLRSHTELARAALESPLLSTALELADWCGPITDVDVDGLPDLHDTRNAIRRFGLWPRHLCRDPRRRDDWLRRISSPRQAHRFLHPWRTALRLGLVECETAQARPAPGLGRRMRSSEQVLRWWMLSFRECVDRSLREVAGVEPDTALSRLYESPDGARIPPRMMTHEVMTAQEESYLPMSCPGRSTGRLARGLRELRDSGAVELGHGLTAPSRDMPRDHRNDPLWVELTALGRYGIRQILLSQRRSAPLLGEFVRLDAGAFLDALASFSPDGQLVALTSWSDARTPEETLREIVAVSAGPGRALRRWNAALTLGTTSSRIEPRLRRLLDERDPTVASLASVVLLASQMLSEQERRTLTARFGHWTAIDVFAAATALGETGLRSFLVSEAAEGIDRHLFDDVHRLWAPEHPDTREVLRVLGRYHPDPSVAARARAVRARAPHPP
ncbi:hypothetical protein [Nocardiopsis sp. MG754419]|uniref:hypothetical protein n=1 Tax=Nocardiopsis sp. MG754419 TaxID=2259865 RepID=UPI001BACECEF|nr:hypothetical protein [Nocardiopsis sp. MG754419]MBR8743016.1 hypothetical protein [Nocardiopsis sp. MG754419]